VATEIPHFFYNQMKKIYFHYKGVAYNCSTIRTGVDYSTLAKMLEGGVNHFLTHYHEEDLPSYNEICKHIFTTIVACTNERNEKLDGPKYAEIRANLIEKYCSLDNFLIEKICLYIKDVTINNIQANTSATTDVTLEDSHCNILSCASLAIKFTFIYGSILLDNLDDMKYDDSIKIFIDNVIHTIVKFAWNIFDLSSLAESEESLHDNIDSFLLERATNLWNTNTNSSFRSKFEEVGKDTLDQALKNRISMFASLKMYFPPLLHEDLVPKYSDVPIKLKYIYYSTTKDRHDFKYLNLNLVGYIQGTLTRIVTTQDVFYKLPSINPLKCIEDEDLTNGLFKDDKDVHLFEVRAEKSIRLLETFIAEFTRCIKIYNIDTSLSFISNISLDKKHVFNKYLLSSIFVCFTADVERYTKIFGPYSRFLLLLLYIKMKASTELQHLHKIIDAMLLTPSSVSNNEKEEIEEILYDAHLSELPIGAFEKICRFYSNQNYQINISPKDLISLHELLSNQHKLRNLLFPLSYPSPDKDGEDYMSPKEEEISRASDLLDKLIPKIEGENFYGSVKRI